MYMYIYICMYIMQKRIMTGLPWWLSGKESVYQEGDVGLIPELRRSPV